MDQSRPKCGASWLHARTPRPQAAHSQYTALALSSVMINKSVTTDIPDQSRLRDSPQQESSPQDCPFMKLPAELRLEIYRLAFQHDLDAINSTPQFYKLASHPFRGALALLHTCRTLRAESIDAIGTSARDSRAALRERSHLANSYTDAMVESWFSRGVKAKASVMAAWSNSRRLHIGTLKIEKICKMLALAVETDKKIKRDQILKRWMQVAYMRTQSSQGAIATG